MVKSNLQHEDSKMISKVESSEPLRILADKNLKLKFSTSIETLKGIGQTQCQLEFGAIIFELEFLFLFFQGRTWSYDKVNFERMGVGGRQSYDNFIWEMTRVEASRICDSRVRVFLKVMHAWVTALRDVMHCVQIRYIWNKYLIFFIFFHLHRMSELFPQVFPLFEQQY